METTTSSLYVEDPNGSEIARHGYTGKGKFIEVLDAFFKLVSMIHDPSECNNEQDEEHDDDEDGSEEEETNCSDTVCYSPRQHEELLAAQEVLKELLGKQLLGKIKVKPDDSQTDLNSVDGVEAINKIYADTYRTAQNANREEYQKILRTMRYWPKLTFVNSDLNFELSQEVSITDSEDDTTVDCNVVMTICMRQGDEVCYNLGIFAMPSAEDPDTYTIQPHLAKRLIDILDTVEGGI